LSQIQPKKVIPESPKAPIQPAPVSKIKIEKVKPIKERRVHGGIHIKNSRTYHPISERKKLKQYRCPTVR
jgi:hypothetical protein